MGILLLGLFTGIVFGYVLQRVGVTQCACLFNALSLRNTKGIKVMGTAIALGIIVLFPIAALGGVELGDKNLYIGGVLVGGALFGIGFALTGLCPGSALAALGGGKKDVFYLLGGALAGSFAYSIVYAPIRPFLIDPLNYGGVTIPDLIGGSPLIIGYIFAAILISIILWLNKRDREMGQLDQDACVLPSSNNKSDKSA